MMIKKYSLLLIILIINTNGQAQVPDTTFVESIYFAESQIYSSDDILKKRAEIHHNYNKLETQIPLAFSQELEQTIQTYYTYRWVPRIFALLDYYRPLFDATFNQYELPIELRYIAIVESNLNPQAISHMGASGLWQFMPTTGRQYGLIKNNYINLWYDPYASTDAAAKFFTTLYKQFGDWNLAMSAYNCGAGCVNRAISRAGTKDYFRVRQFLPKETRDYVMRFHTIKFLHYYYELYYDTRYNFGIDYSKIQETKADKNTTFKEFAIQNKLNKAMLYFLNPQITTEKIPKNSFIYFIK